MVVIPAIVGLVVVQLTSHVVTDTIKKLPGIHRSPKEVVPGGGTTNPPGLPGGLPPAPTQPPPSGGSPGLVRMLCTILNSLGLPVQVPC